MIEKLKVGDKVMGVPNNKHPIFGFVHEIEHIGINNQYAIYHIVNSKEEYLEILSESMIVRFDPVKWMQVETLYREYKKLIDEAENKISTISTVIYSTDSKKIEEFQ